MLLKTGGRRSNGIENLVTLTGDMHTYIASQLKLNYNNVNPFDFGNFMGVEFMTPSITSTNLISGLGLQRQQALLKKRAANANSLGDLIDFFASAAVYALNPHIKYFDSSAYGYSTLEFRRSYCEWIGYAIDKNAGTGTPARRVKKKKMRKYVGLPSLFTWY